MVVLTAGHLRFTDEHGKSQGVFAKPGESRWFPPFTHRVENLGNTPYNAVYIGIKNPRTQDRAALGSGTGELDEQSQKFVTEAIVAAARR